MWPYTEEELRFINGEHEEEQNKEGRLLSEGEGSLHPQRWDMAFSVWFWSFSPVPQGWSFKLG